MQQLKPALNTLLAAVLAAMFSLTTLFLAPLPLLVLRRKYGRNALVAAFAVGFTALYFAANLPVALTFAGAFVLTTVLSECEHANVGYSASVFVTVLVLAGMSILLSSFAVHYLGFEPVGFFRDQIAVALSQLKLPADVTLDKEALLRQVPSGLLMLTIFAVWLNSIMVPRIEKLLGWGSSVQGHQFTSAELLQWKLPDVFVWVALVSAAGNFLEFEPHWLKWTCTNAFNVCVMLYFFQGLAVVVNFFNVKRVGPLWRMIGYLLIFTQLFLAVAFIGFVDLWMEFRNRKKTDKSAMA